MALTNSHRAKQDTSRLLKRLTPSEGESLLQEMKESEDDMRKKLRQLEASKNLRPHAQ